MAAVDDEGEVLDLVIQHRRDTEAAIKLLKRLLHNQFVERQTITPDGLASYGTALDQLNPRQLRRPGRLRENNQIENPNLPIRRRARQQQRFKSQGSAENFLTTRAGDRKHLPNPAPSDQQTRTSAIPRRSRRCMIGHG
nr:DDE-type integrase/transposase/recombinase [Brevundimonas subvibrioides]